MNEDFQFHPIHQQPNTVVTTSPRASPIRPVKVQNLELGTQKPKNVAPNKPTNPSQRTIPNNNNTNNTQLHKARPTADGRSQQQIRGVTQHAIDEETDIGYQQERHDNK